MNSEIKGNTSIEELYGYTDQDPQGTHLDERGMGSIQIPSLWRNNFDLRKLQTHQTCRGKEILTSRKTEGGLWYGIYGPMSKEILREKWINPLKRITFRLCKMTRRSPFLIGRETIGGSGRNEMYWKQIFIKNAGTNRVYLTLPLSYHVFIQNVNISSKQCRFDPLPLTDLVIWW
ncbi:hypothetical protein D5086_026759 [Populus alba]|uniref:Uncharacterized protein n=2 Tax=Populus TaxID=3689 RepID=A0ACC4B2V2_POPAL